MEMIDPSPPGVKKFRNAVVMNERGGGVFLATEERTAGRSSTFTVMGQTVFEVQTPWGAASRGAVGDVLGGRSGG
ncbi:hypothetical protein [Sphaerisporangium sp. NPDC051011]|uniref:hypothetical protein n=1 Tax=Sphaerisporangium sp. NPDC051011 TaxID=3155792 RepID=UPI0033E3A1D4